MKYFDKENKRLVFIEKAADSDYWDEHWQSDQFEKLVKVENERFVVGNTKKYLPTGAKILEGGCGRGDKVYALSHHGYDAYGVDYAQSTIERIKRCAPELKVMVSDVRNLDFEDAVFDGYWSLGVIEHFYNGYDAILKEMKRVLKKGGYLFLTFPSMSLLRRLKVKMNAYPPFESATDMDGFYQFILEPSSVKRKFVENGFELIDEKSLSGVKGLKDEVLIFKPFLQKIFDAQNKFLKVINVSLNILLSGCFGHMKFMIFRKM